MKSQNHEMNCFKYFSIVAIGESKVHCHKGKTVQYWRDLLVGVGHGGDGLRDGRVHGVEARVDGEARGRGGC